jgi:hypothetical protein
MVSLGRKSDLGQIWTQKMMKNSVVCVEELPELGYVDENDPHLPRCAGLDQKGY